MWFLNVIIITFHTEYLTQTCTSSIYLPTDAYTLIKIIFQKTYKIYVTFSII